MPLDTPLNVFPYFDDFAVDNEFYGIGFKPKVSVQARELNQMQSILRHQIEKFGDAIFQVGTIIDGCNFNFLPSYPYVKIKDLSVTGLNVTPQAYVGLFTKNAANLQAIIINSAQGFETTPPDLNTLYLSYRNSGNDGNTYAYSGGDVLTVFDSNTGIWSVSVNTAGVGFANSDSPVFVSGLAVNVTSGSFSNGDYVTQPSTGANLQIIGIDTTTLASSGQIVLSLKPRGVDLANASANGTQWATANADSIRNAGNTAVGTVMSVIGSGAQGAITTDGSGRVLSVAMTNRGQGYTTLPTVTIKSPNNASGISGLSLVPQNYVTQVTVSNTVGGVGAGYAFQVSDGTIYQKGLFLKVRAQTIIVEKYSGAPNNVSVGFKSQEQIITSDIDQSLLDNAEGFPNAQAPGADRIKITPELVLFSSDTTDPAILPIVSWSEGYPYRQNQTTSYSTIGDKMAQNIYESEGNFVLSRFEVTTRSPVQSNTEGSKVSVIVNPGSAYIGGRRVKNETNYSVDIYKTTDTITNNNQTISLNYGNWIRVKELGGVFQFNTGDVVTFYDQPRAFISGTTAANTTPLGNAIGTARVRSLTHEFGIPGDANTSYRMYLFSINLNQGANFRDIRSVAYTTGTYAGIADVVLTPDATTGTNIAQLANANFDYLMFDSGAYTLKNATNVTYQYRTIDQGTAFANTGLLAKNISATPSETFPYSGALTSSQLQDIYVVPVGNNLVAAANATGSANVLNSNTVILGNATTWLTDFAPGDYVRLFQNSTVSDVRRVISVGNNTAMTLDANVAFTGNNNGVYRYFPKNAPIPFGLRTGLTANVSANQQLLTLNLGIALSGSVTVNTAVGVNILRTNVTAASKSAGRDQLVKLQLSNNAGGTSGPWCLGVSDIFRLKKVYLGTSNSVSNSSPDVTSFFYIDHKQNEDWVDLGYLYVKPNSGLSLTSSNFLLVQFDAFQSSGSGYFNTTSYVGANAAVIQAIDSTPLANLGSSISSWEIPECYGSRGQYFDLAKYFDFRPIAANTVTPTTNSATAPVNPAYSLSFGNTANPANDKKFPLPDSALTYNLEQYCYRVDSVFADTSGKITVVKGKPVVNNPSPPSPPSGTIRLVNLYLPSYPVLPSTLSPMQTEICATRIACMNYTFQRQAQHTITVPSQPGTPYDTQPRRYTHADVGKLDRRIQTLEYYQSLSTLQTDMVNKVIPSSSDGSINRFKFGIFVDAFDNGVSQDMTNPSYAAGLSYSDLTPPYVDWVVPYSDAKSATNPYIDFNLVAQTDATFHQNTSTPNTTVTAANTWMLRTDHLAPSQSGQIVLTDYAYPVFANVAGPATLYFYINPTASIISGLIDPDNFAIYQGQTKIADAYHDAVALTSTDIAYLKSTAVPANWFVNDPLTTPLSRPVSGFVNGAGKITFSHNPSGGSQYTIVSTRQSAYDHWKWGLEYPSVFGTQLVSAPVSSGTGSSYNGHMDVEPPALLLAMTTPTTTITDYGHGVALTNFGLNVQNPTDYTSFGRALQNFSVFESLTPWGQGVDDKAIAQVSKTLVAQSFGIVVYGLKPSTGHQFYVNNVNKTGRTQVPGQFIGDPIVTNASGVARFNYFFDGNVADQDTTSSFSLNRNNTMSWALEQAGAIAQPVSMGNLTLVLHSPGGGSDATFTLQVVADAELALNTVGAVYLVPVGSEGNLGPAGALASEGWANWGQ